MEVVDDSRPPMLLRCEPFGTAPHGSAVERWTFGDPEGVTAVVLTYGAILQSVFVPGEEGGARDVVLGFPDLDGYLDDQAYMGAVVGRYANRIANGHLTIDDSTFELPRNDRGHTLHGGPDGFHRQVWAATGSAATDRAEVRLRLRSPHGAMGFPGTLDVEVAYRVDRQGNLSVRYQASTDRTTVVNLTQHAYWNLAGHGDVLGHELAVAADTYLPTDASGIPLAAPAPVKETPFALNAPLRKAVHSAHPQTAAVSGVDHCFVLRGGRTSSPRAVACLADPATGRRMTVRTTEPGLQVYTANALRAPFAPHSAVCLETQHFPDAPNRPDMPSTLLRVGDTYTSTTVYQFDSGSSKLPSDQ